MLHRSTLTLTIALASCVALSVAACSGGGVQQCVEHSECVSGLCRADGTCAPADGADAGVAPDADPLAPDGGLAACSPDHDGVVRRDEVVLAPGNQAIFRVALDSTVDTAGQQETGGERTWDFSTSLVGDADVNVLLTSIEGAWYADAFPGASYATKLSESADLIGVFELTGTALMLRGVVSPEGGLTRTELQYDPPATLLAFPISTTSIWSSTSTVSGVAQGIASFYTEKYESRVDATGDLITPFGTFPVQRIRVELTRTVGAVPVTIRSFVFMSECFGTVATVTSQDYESEIEFTTAAEIRRLAL